MEGRSMKIFSVFIFLALALVGCDDHSRSTSPPCVDAIYHFDFDADGGGSIPEHPCEFRKQIRLDVRGFLICECRPEWNVRGAQ
jgi:hypothetical protein